MSEPAGLISRPFARRMAAAVLRVERDGGGPRNAAGMAMVMRREEGAGGVIIRPTANAASGGAYTGFTVIAPTGPISSAAGVTEASFGVNGIPCLILNAAESGKVTHDLTLGTPTQKTFIGCYLKMSSDVPPVPVYVINGFDPGCE